MRLTSDEAISSFPMPANHELRVLYVTSACDPDHTISASAFWWVDALARRCARVDVIALETGGQPRHNVVLYPLQRSRYRWRWLVIPRMARLLWKLVPRADVVFCQYSTKFVFAAWPFAAILRRRIVLWWSHAHVDWRLRLATQLVGAVVTSSPDSFRIATAKKRVIGHGIDVEMFSPPNRNDVGANPTPRPVRILSIGRITPLKDVRTIVRAAGLLRARGRTAFTLDLVGNTGRAGDAEYYEELKALARELRLDGVVRFLGPVPHSLAAELLRGADVFVNAQAAGGVGRAWLEAMAVGVPPVLCSSALDHVLDDGERRLLRFRDHDSEDLADRLETLIAMQGTARRKLGARLREIVVRDHSLEHLAMALHGVLRDVTGRARRSASAV